MRLTVSFALAAGAAYAFSFAIDLLLGGLIGLYPSTAFLPVVTWSALSALALLAAEVISRGNRWLALPYVAFGLLAVLGGAVGSHPHNFAVAGLMFLHAYPLWKMAHHSSAWTTIWWPFKKKAEGRLLQYFEVGLRSTRVSLCKRMMSPVPMDEEHALEPASVLAAQVANYLTGEDILEVMQGSAEPLKSEIGRIKDQVPQRATNVMSESEPTREVVVATLRMKEALEFMLHGESYLHSDQHRRIYGLLLVYGPEFPEEITPEKYLAIAHRYHQETFAKK